MSTTLIVFFTAVITLALGFFLGHFIQKLKQQAFRNTANAREEELNNRITTLNKDLDSLKEETKGVRIEKESLAIELTKREANLEYLKTRHKEQQEEVTRLQEKLNKDFQVLANRILEEKTQKFTDQNQENLKNILNPLQEKIKVFEKKVEETNEKSLMRHTSLTEQLKNLKDLNERITKEASNLTRALKGDTKMQGNWGELVLERVLEKSGLQKDSEYFVQNSFTTEEGKRVMPDVIIHMPDDKKMIVDSKVSLLAYERFVNAEEEADKKSLLKEHLSALKRHVDQLSAKNYHQIYQMESPDFVLLFIPMEPAFALASQEDPQLYNYAFEKNIVIVTPSTLLATLRTIESMWQNDKQHKNAVEIAIQAGRLYDQFSNLLEDLEKVGKQLQTVQNSYSSSMTKLTGRGNLLTRVEKLKKLGAKASKQIDQKWLNRAAEDELPEEAESLK